MSTFSYGPTNNKVRERQVLYGAGNAGKTTAMLSLARRYSSGHIHIMDADDAWEFALFDDEEPNKKLLERGNFTIHHIDDEKWDGEGGHFYVAQAVEKLVEPGDIVVYDKINGGWGAAQDWYDHNVFGVGHAEYYIQMRQLLEEERQAARSEKEKEKRTQPLYDQLRDWGPINAQYKLLYATLSRINREAHLFVLTDAAALHDKDDGDMRKACLPFGAKPAGQKRLYGFPHTVLYLSHDMRTQTFEISQVKDRGTRLVDQVEEEPWDADDGGFAKAYMTPKAKWKMRKDD